MEIIAERDEPRGKPRYVSPSPVVDGAGNIFIGCAQTRGEGTQFTRNALVLKVTPTGGVSVADERGMPDGGLADGVGIVQVGRDLHVFPGHHIGDPRAQLLRYILPGVCVPHIQGGGSLRPIPVSSEQRFSDVGPDNPFFSEINSLSLMGAIGGYDDQTFRPNNPTTRGQLAKILVRALRYISNQ